MTSIEEVQDLLQKNKKRLYKELRQSKELMQLLRKSTSQPLNQEEKVKVKSQTYDILKGIPAFAVFMLPGGVLLLPLVIKLIPSILPSSFRENSEEEEE